MKKLSFLSIALIGLLTACVTPTTTSTTTAATDLSGMKEQAVTLDELIRWPLSGQGNFILDGTRQALLEEAPGSAGVTITSPESYGDVVLRYKVMTLNAATVMVTLLSLSDPGEATGITYPEGYNGNMGFLTSGCENYFVAFRNSPHVTAPFIRKYPADETFAIADKDLLLPGVYYDVEMGRKGAYLWLKIDGELVVEATDPAPISGGHLAIRTRGIANHPAACVVRDVVIYTPQ